MAFTLRSQAFQHKGIIPVRYTCKGENISPQLEWTDPPDGTESYTLIMDDPDAPAGTWVHWVLYRISGTIMSIPEGINPAIAAHGVFGQNSWGKMDYGGPCPQSGTHRYFFKLYALNTMIQLEPGKEKPEVLRAMQGHILEMAEIMGTFSR